MNIVKILNNNNQNSALYKNNSVSFKAGKIHLYSDFDHTFIPMNIEEFQYKCSEGKFDLKEYFNKMFEFCRKAGKNFKFTITTGRTIDEFIETGYSAIRNNIKIPLPKNLITQDGTRKYTKILPDFIGGKMNYYPAPLSWFSRIDVADKKFDTTVEVYKNLKDKNYIITAGDGSNDLQMLNPMTYLEYYMREKLNDKNYHIDYELSKDGIKTFFSSNKEMREIFENLPFIGIAIYRDKYPERFLKLIDAFGPSSKEFQKVVIVKEGQLLEGLKQALEILDQNSKKPKKNTTTSIPKLKKSLLKAKNIL
ncbi:hypothetical protein IJZ97_02225 [bacterium]|nr:hypothetical protein [bacterium]